MGTEPYYIIGTEVPTPGGAKEKIEHLQATRPEAVRTTYEAHRAAFAAAGAEAAFGRVVALVVQPGVEFGNANVVVYDSAKARALSATLEGLPGLVFEAHSTDYQPGSALAALVRDGFAILKVGPALTFAYREAVYGLDLIANALDAAWDGFSVKSAMEAAMLANPDNWQAHYHGTPVEQRALRHFSYSDRVRYYWPAPAVQEAVERLLSRLGTAPIPETLISQYLATIYPQVAARAAAPTAEALLVSAVRRVLDVYAAASG